jgi:hypothetical protein
MKTSLFGFPLRVRIHGGECGAVARALHHEAKSFSLPAVGKKVFLTTHERKVMSKPTFFKRVALSAIAAMGLSMLSIAPSQASVLGETLTIGADSSATTATYSSSITAGETATAVLAHSFTATGSTDSVVVQVVQGSSAHQGSLKFFLTDSSLGRSTTQEPTYTSNAANDSGTNIIANLTNAQNANNITSFVVSDSGVTSARRLNTVVSLRLIAPSVAGTYTFDIITSNWNDGQNTNVAASGKIVTWTVTVAAKTVAADASSTSTLRAGTARVGQGTKEGTDSAVTATRSVLAAGPAATIWVNLKNATATADESIIASVSGPAYLSGATDTSTRNTANLSITVKNKWLGQAYDTDYTPITVWSNGTAGTATVTISTVSGLTVGTETINFFGPVTSLAVDTTYNKVLRAGGYATSGIIDLVAKDAKGIGVDGLTITMVSSNTNAVSSSAIAAACTSYVAAGYPSLAGYYYCDATTVATSTSGMASTLTYRVVNPAVTTTTEYLTATHAVTLGGSVSSVTFTANKATYEPGEKITLTATAKDSSGNPVYDGAAGPTGIVVTKALGGTLTMNAYYDGVSTSQKRSSVDPRSFTTGNEVYAPATAGNFTFSYTYGTYSEKNASLTLTVSDDAATAAAAAASDAAAEAIDAANAATDAANLAAEAADAATVAAEEARDAADAATAAVEELATQVATLMAALKAQITTLANTVAKIAKKVKA